MVLTEAGELATGGPLMASDPRLWLTAAGMAEARKQDRIDQARREAAMRGFFHAVAARLIDGLFDAVERGRGDASP
jgi:hypothetical protein